jgi:hypothetical protein
MGDDAVDDAFVRLGTYISDFQRSAAAGGSNLKRAKAKGWLSGAFGSFSFGAGKNDTWLWKSTCWEINHDREVAPFAPYLTVADRPS